MSIKNFRPVTDEEILICVTQFETALCEQELGEGKSPDEWLQTAVDLAKGPSCDCGSTCDQTMRMIAAQLVVLKIAMLQRMPQLSRLN